MLARSIKLCPWQQSDNIQNRESILMYFVYACSVSGWDGYRLVNVFRCLRMVISCIITHLWWSLNNASHRNRQGHDQQLYIVPPSRKNNIYIESRVALPCCATLPPQKKKTNSQREPPSFDDYSKTIYSSVSAAGAMEDAQEDHQFRPSLWRCHAMFAPAGTEKEANRRY